MDKLAEMLSFEGRANRAWYIWHILLDDLVMFTAFIVFVVLTLVTGSPIFILPGVGVLLAGGWAGIAITVKRLHDLDRPGWHWWLLLVPLVNIYIGVILLFQRGTWGRNQFGPDPLQAAKADDRLMP